MSIQVIALDIISAVLDFFVNIIEWLRRLLPLDRIAGWIQVTFPFLEEAHTLIITVALAVLIIWFVWSWASHNLRKNAGYIILFGFIIAISAYMGNITWT